MNFILPKSLLVTLTGLIAVVVAGQIVLFVKLQSLQDEIAELRPEKTGFERSLQNGLPGDFPSILSQGFTPEELKNANADLKETPSELQPPLKLTGMETAKPIIQQAGNATKSKSLLSEEEKLKIWQEEFRDLDAESVKEILKIRTAIERSSKLKKK